ncbi:hypothetical protein FHX81_6912 [Saccharothrix saharensis]|uniref:Uncharacterized protein n=1 Tax=Saccharothrix saharensis TaxID=571190 RepID=A0A543JNQ0_9PSEU|nr:hypothetical protein [Saccharothrix saharensis]TQM84466.1 hypothetical protein FHX81_6912 [Saccharothrix saharensis]
MTSPASQTAVLVLDVRELGDDRTALASLDPDTGSELLPSYVVVVANVSELADLAPDLTRLAKVQHLGGVVLVAVGSLRAEDAEAVLGVPTALTGLGVTLWVGAEAGLEWSGGASRGVAARPDVTLDDLISALKLPLVFDRVHKAVSQVPHQAAAPAIEIEYATVPDSVLRVLRLRALRHFADDDGEAHRADGPLAAAVRTLATRAGDGRAAIASGSALDRSRQVAAAALAAAGTAVDAVRRPFGLFTGNPGTGEALSTAAQRLAEYRALCVDTERRVARSVDVGDPPEARLVELGLPPQPPHDVAGVADVLADAVDQELALGRPLKVVSDSARQIATRLTGPVGRDNPVADVDVGPALRALRGGDRRPVDLAPLPLLPLVFCFAAAMTAGVVGGVAAAIAWLLPVYRLCAVSAFPVRRRTFVVAGSGVAALVGAAAGVVLRAVAPEWALDLPPVGVAATAAGWCVAAPAVCAVIWWRVHVRWSAALELDRAGSAQRRLTQALTELVRSRWLPAAGTTRLADSLLNVAVALDAVDQAFTETASAFGGGGRPPEVFAGVDSTNDLNHVLREDLAHLVRSVLRPVFVEIASNGVLTGEGRPFYLAAQARLAEYNHHLDTRGIRVPPPGLPDQGRGALATGIWQASAKVQRILLSGPRSPLPQLCRPTDLRLLGSGESAMVFFASADIVDPPVNPSYELIRTNGNAVGVLRLVPLRPGVVRPLIDHGEAP